MKSISILAVGLGLTEAFALVVILGMIALVIFLFFYARRVNRRAREETERWAGRSGWQLLEFESRRGPGPFGGVLVSRGHAYYRFVVSNPDGRRKTGWLRLDISAFGGGASEVRWEEEG